MKLPIAYALRGKVQEQILKPLNLLDLQALEFKEITQDRYPIWQIKEHLLSNPDMGVVLNAANEAAIERFEAGEFGFFAMVDLILQGYKKFEGLEIGSLDDIYRVDSEVREFVRELKVN
jgi:1-deoxy-D-xylulose-5-phosphate reductoisomerase